MPTVTGQNVYIASDSVNFRTGEVTKANISYNSGSDKLFFSGDLVFQDPTASITGRLEVSHIEVTGAHNPWAGTDTQYGAIYLSDEGRGLLGNFGGDYARPMITANSNKLTIGSNGTSVIRDIDVHPGNGAGAAMSNFNVFTSGVKRMTVTRTGNIGFGGGLADNPNHAFVVDLQDSRMDVLNGSVKIRYAANNDAITLTPSVGNEARILASDGDTSTPHPLKIAADQIRFTTSGVSASNEVMRLTSEGNVGIGTNDPDVPLEVAMNSRELINLGSSGPNATIQLASSSSTIFGSIGARQTNTSQSALGFLAATPNSSTATYGDMFFSTRENDDSDFSTTADKKAFSFVRYTSPLMTIMRDGKVGIGTDDPTTAKLRIKGTTNDSSELTLQCIDSTDTQTFFVRNDGVVQVTDNYFYVSSNAGAYVQHDLRVRGSLSNDGGALVVGGDVNFDVNTLFVDSTNDRVGIGTNTPALPLHVEGSVLIDGYNQTSGSGQGIFFRQGFTASNKYNLSILTYNDGDGSSDALDINAYDGINFCVGSNTRNPKVSIKSDGDVGIGTVSPSQLLNVSGGHILIDHQDPQLMFNDIGGSTYTSSWMYSNNSMEFIWGGGKKFTIDSAGGVTLGQDYSTNHSAPSKGLIMEGRLGIGVVAPDNPIEVSGSDNGIKIYSISTDRPRLTFDCGDAVKLILSSNSNYGAIGDSTDTNRYMAFRDGKVGIGTNDPVTLLHINGSSPKIRLRDSDAAGTPLAHIDGSDGALKLQADSSSETANSFLTLEVDGFEYVRVTAGGDVGIGTDNPSKQLTLRDPSPYLRLEENSSGGNKRLDLFVSNSTGVIGANQSAQTMMFQTIGENRMTIEPAGNVGIGTTNPTELLEVDGNIKLGDGGTRDIIGPTNESLRILSNPNASSEGIVFSTDAGATTGMFLQDGNNVGIGSNAPAKKLDVDGYVQVQNSADSSSRLYLKGGRSYFLTSTAGSDFGLYDDDVSAYRLYVKSDGNVGIGTNNPASLLELHKYGAGSSTDLLNVGGTGNGRMLVRHIDGKSSTSASAQALYLNYISTSSVSIAYGGGNVGIGTHNPSSVLHVHGSDPVIKVTDTSASDNGASLFLQETDDYGVKLTYDALGSNLDLFSIDTKYVANDNNVLGDYTGAWGIDRRGNVRPHKGAVDGNLLRPYEWHLDGTTNSGSLPFWNLNGAVSENQRVSGYNPFGEPAILWANLNQDSGNDADGGWNTDTFVIDRRKQYRTSVWVRKDTDTPASGHLYLGTRNVDNISNGAFNSNPYFLSPNMTQTNPDMVSGKWYLFVGYIHPSGTPVGGASDEGGVYDRDGTKIIDANSFRWTSSGNLASVSSEPNPVKTMQRVYNYYDTNSTSKIYWYAPRFEPMEASTPTLQELLNTPSTDVGAFFGGNVGIGTTKPSTTNALDVVGNVAFDEYIYHRGDEDTNIKFVDDDFMINVGGATFFRATETTQNTIKFNSDQEDTDFYLYRASSSTPAIFARGSDGEVGINTTNPTASLHVVGNARIKGSSSDGVLSMENAAGSQTLRIDQNSIRTTTNNNLTFLTNGNSNSLVLQQSTNHLGIGAVPTSALHLSTQAVGPDGAPVTTMTKTIATSTIGAKLSFTGGSNTTNNIIGGLSMGNVGEEYAGMYSIDGGASSTTHLALFAGNSTSTNEVMRLLSDGNVGIGITTPEELLHVKAADTVKGVIKVEGGKNTVSSVGEINSEIQFGSNDPSVGGDNIGGKISSVTENSNGAWVGLGFYTYHQTVSDLSERMRITKEGRVGIGMTEPDVNLNVSGTGKFDSLAWAELHLNGANGGEIKFQKGGTTYLDIYASNAGSTASVIKSQSDLRLSSNNSVAANRSLWLDSDGKVGIGTDNPGAKLDIRTPSNTNGILVKSDTDGSNVFNQWIDSSDNGQLWLYPDGGTASIKLNTAGDSSFNGGNVGIGSASPAAFLDVSKDNSNAGNQFVVADTEGVSAAIRTYTHGGSPAGLILNHYYAEGGSSNEYARYADFVANVGNGAATKMRFITKNAANTYSTTIIDNNGDVGIGTADPDAHLNVYNTGTTSSVADMHIVGSGNTYGLLVERRRNDSLIVSKSTTAGSYFKTDSTTTSFQGYEIGSNWFIGQYGYNDLRILDGAKSGGDSATALTIQDSTKFVGVKHSNPRHELDVSGVIAQSLTTVNSLPSVGSSAGARSMVSDSQFSAAGNFGATIAGYGGGSYTVPVWCDGAYWYIG
jgi:hypothetical protein